MQKAVSAITIVGHEPKVNRSSIDQDIAADNGLKICDKVASRYQGIIGFMRKGRMPPPSP